MFGTKMLIGAPFFQKPASHRPLLTYRSPLQRFNDNKYFVGTPAGWCEGDCERWAKREGSMQGMMYVYMERMQVDDPAV